MDVQEAIARLEIQDVLWRYARGVDRSDLDLLLSVYHPEATDHHASFSGSGQEFARSLVERHRDVAAVGQHNITNMTVEFTGPDDAKVESYFLAFHPHSHDGSTRLGIASGRYLDHFQRRDGAWKILARRVVMDWTRDHVEGAPWDGADGRPTQGLPRRLGDESYALLDGGSPGA